MRCEVILSTVAPLLFHFFDRFSEKRISNLGRNEKKGKKRCKKTVEIVQKCEL